MARNWIYWTPGEPEDALLGFCFRAERDAFERGEKGPFRRVIRTSAKSFEAELIAAFCSRATQQRERL